IEEESKRYIEEIERREQQRWQRRVRIYQLVLIGAALVLLASFINRQLNSNRALEKKLKSAEERVEMLQKVNADQANKIQNLEQRLKNAGKPSSPAPMKH